MAVFALSAIGMGVSAYQGEKARKDASKAAKEQKNRLAKLEQEAKNIGPPPEQDTTSAAKKFARKTGRAGSVVTGDLTPVSKKETLFG